MLDLVINPVDVDVGGLWVRRLVPCLGSPVQFQAQSWLSWLERWLAGLGGWCHAWGPRSIPCTPVSLFLPSVSPFCLFLPSVCLPACLAGCLSVWLAVSVCLSVCPSVCLSLSLSSVNSSCEYILSRKLIISNCLYRVA